MAQRPDELIRCFAAIDVFTPEITRAISNVGRELIEAGLIAKQVDPETLHVTLQFFGEQPPEVVERLKEELSGIRFRPFTVKLTGIGYFPGGGRINVVWVGVQDPSGEMHGLQRTVVERAAKLGLRPDKEFAPHITILRVKGVSNKPKVLQAIGRLSAVEIGEVRVDRFKLKRSFLRPEGPLYTDLLVVRSSED
ncbi:MAG: RNA 2',3'-cyclic phosphodiesterase [Aigarchaeota archaeon]|nr:RNA 2',3'-cyclic phosphodiesterase [Aigarchaeota archaeon]MCX8203622.1 RNA 2',3'-cyclic phosphodiesterase [Nitrososphaeria archaeon]MDW8043916.1 RNA 2',3'-cyclic phosphodiesterase [Nitrososphaerota archaeon]